MQGHCMHAHSHIPEWLRKILRKIRKHWKHAKKGAKAVRRFVEAAKRVQSGNAKLQKFEQGFISEEGIAEREWYRHLVVAPGKFLGMSPVSSWRLEILIRSLRIWGDHSACGDGGADYREEQHSR